MFQSKSTEDCLCPRRYWAIRGEDEKRNANANRRKPRCAAPAQGASYHLGPHSRHEPPASRAAQPANSAGGGRSSRNVEPADPLRGCDRIPHLSRLGKESRDADQGSRHTADVHPAAERWRTSNAKHLRQRGEWIQGRAATAEAIEADPEWQHPEREADAAR